ncbi:MAG: hypothetical protein OEP48_16250 [Betaproteobacteria bacterium]|nr:hypothetical protein [Betaproteobacteria bacterium]MDH3438227.1 hypothetical protein [Betaproteobacteria bacterium]
MKRLALDYIAPPRRLLWPGVLLLAVSLAVAGELGTRYRDLQVELTRLETASGLVSTERRPSRAVSNKRLEEQAKNAETVIRQLTLPWASLVDTVEDTLTKDVAILQLRPDAQQQLLRLTAEARHQKAMIEYLRRLANARVLADVHVVNHQIQIEDPQRPIQFTVQASFRSVP